MPVDTAKNGNIPEEHGRFEAVGREALPWAGMEGWDEYTLPGRRGVHLEMHGLSKMVPGHAGPKTILHDISLSVPRGALVALVGSNGAGKTTVLRLVAGQQRPDGGHVLLDGADYFENFKALRSRVSYVPQDDTLHGALAVERVLDDTTRLRLPPAGTSHVEIEARKCGALRLTDLTPQRDQLVGHLSGGQRRRVSLAAELVGRPALLLLDEPTSGSDPGLDRRLMTVLRTLADAGMTILLATHSPYLDRCDLVAVMACGRLVFVGPPAEAPAFFGVPDFPAIYATLSGAEAENDPEEIAQVWEQRFRDLRQHADPPHHERYVARQRGPLPPGFSPGASRELGRTTDGRWAALRWGWSQWHTLTRRAFELAYRDRATVCVRLAVPPLVGLLLMLITHPRDLIGLAAAEVATKQTYNPTLAAQNVLFSVALAAVLLGLFAAVNEILREQAIYQRERLAGLGLLPYVLSKVTVLAAQSAAGAALLFLVVCLHLRLPATTLVLPAPAEMYVTLLLTTLAGATLGLALSAIAQSATMAAYLVFFVTLLQVLFSGLLFELPPAIRPLSWLTVIHSSLDALGSTIDVPRLGETAKILGRASPVTQLRIPYAHDSTHVLGRWVALGGLSASFAVLAGICQQAKDPGSWFTRLVGLARRVGHTGGRLHRAAAQCVVRSARAAVRLGRALGRFVGSRVWSASSRAGIICWRCVLFVVGAGPTERHPALADVRGLQRKSDALVAGRAKPRVRVVRLPRSRRRFTSSVSGLAVPSAEVSPGAEGKPNGARRAMSHPHLANRRRLTVGPLAREAISPAAMDGLEH